MDGVDRRPGDPAVEVARAVALAHVLPRLKQHGREAAGLLEAALSRAADLDDREVARLLADADATSRLLATDAPAIAQDHARKLTRAAIDLLPAGAIAPETADRAVSAAGAVARLRCLADALTGPGYDEATAARTAEVRAARAAGQDVGVSASAGRARSAATARAASQALDGYGGELDEAIDLMVRQLSDGSAPVVGPSELTIAKAGVRRRLTSARRRRERRAARLAARIHVLSEEEQARGPEASIVPAGPPKDRALLAWLRRLAHPGLYTAEFEATLAAWQATDPFGLRVLPPPPPFLAAADPSSLEPAHVAPLLRRLSMTRTAPTAGELTPQALDQDRGPTSRSVRTPRLRQWGQAPGSGAPLLPEITELPHVVHGIWLGGPIPRASVFRDNYGRTARRYAGRVDFVVWTDVPRARFDEVRARPKPPWGRIDPLAEERSLLDWAQEHGILLVNVHEVFHAEAPMRLHAPFVLEMAKQLPRGYASASDHLRLEIVTRFGGAYVDGDMIFSESAAEEGGPDPETDLVAFLDRVAASVHGYTMNPCPGLGVGNDVVVGPAGHPAIALWIECARFNYGRSQPAIFGGLAVMARRYIGEDEEYRRYVAPYRTGRVHHQVLNLLATDSDDLPQAKPALLDGHEVSWARPIPGQPATLRPVAEDDVPTVLARCITFLRWQLIARHGDLYLSAVDPVIRRLRDPDTAWCALFRALPRYLPGLPAITSVTDLRHRDDGGVERVLLPPEAEVLLDRSARPAGWLGAPLSPQGGPVRLLDEYVSPVALRSPEDARPDHLELLAPLAELTVNTLGHVVGLWLRSPRTAHVWRHEARFETVPPGTVRICLGGPQGQDWVQEFGVGPEGVAQLVLASGAAGRPVELTVPLDGTETMGPFARELERLLGRPVSLVEGGFTPGMLAPPSRVRRLVPRLSPRGLC